MEERGKRGRAGWRYWRKVYTEEEEEGKEAGSRGKERCVWIWVNLNVKEKRIHRREEESEG